MKILLIILTIVTLQEVLSNTTNATNKIFSSEGDLKIALLIEDCNITNNIRPPLERTSINTAIWIVNRLNTLQFLRPYELGLDIYGICDGKDYYKSIFKIFEDNIVKENLLGGVFLEELPPKIDELTKVLSVPMRQSVRFLEMLLKAAVKVLVELEITDNVVVLAPNLMLLKDFYRHARKEWICVNNFVVYNNNTTFIEDGTFDGNVLVFGDYEDITYFIKQNVYNYNNATIFFIPLDGKSISNLPDNTIIIEPTYSTISNEIEDHPKLLPSPILLDIANPILSLTKHIAKDFQTNCNDPNNSINCEQKIRVPTNYIFTPPLEIIRQLKIEPILSEFVYNIYKVEKLFLSRLISSDNASDFEFLRASSIFQRHVKLFTYNIFDDKMTDFYEVSRNRSENETSQRKPIVCAKNYDRCILECANFKAFSMSKTLFHPKVPMGIVLRTEAWVYAVLSLALLGVVFCFAIFIFLIVKCIRKSTLEGNPLLTIILLLSALILFGSVIPFVLQSIHYKDVIYLARFLFVSLPYTLTFSLLLSRCILLATISKETGFMSHASGYVQCFLVLFIFCVQCAITLQILRKCEDIFRGYLLVYLLSYNVFLLFLLICISPLILKSRRNYKEGKYFTVSILLIACSWCFWLPGYAYLDQEWKDPMLCVGLISTGSILLVGIFIPRTYLMTISSARDRFTSVLPSLATVTSALDIYRASTQPIYDCVNIAAIHAANTARSACSQPLVLHQQSSTPCPSQVQAQDLYGPPRIAEHYDEEFQVEDCNSPTPDKITRF